MHAPPWHVSSHSAPQPPQLLLSVEKSAQPPLHELYPLSQAKVHALSTHAADALATPGDGQRFVHVPQSFTLLVVFTHSPLQTVGADAGHVQTEFSHMALPLQAYAEPQPPQLLSSLVKFTHAPLQRV